MFFFILNSYIEHNKVSGFWATMFVLSKVPELGDTIFIVLRKQPLIFLHWYHHATVLVYSWSVFTHSFLRILAVNSNLNQRFHYYIR